MVSHMLCRLGKPALYRQEGAGATSGSSSIRHSPSATYGLRPGPSGGVERQHLFILGVVNDFRGGQRSSRAPSARCRTVIVAETPFIRVFQ